MRSTFFEIGGLVGFRALQIIVFAELFPFVGEKRGVRLRRKEW